MPSHSNQYKNHQSKPGNNREIGGTRFGLEKGSKLSFF